MNKFKVGENWVKNPDENMLITAVGIKRILYTKWGGSKAPEFSMAICDTDDWAKTHEADGSPFCGYCCYGGEETRPIVWQADRGLFAAGPEGILTWDVAAAVGMTRFIAFEYEDGYRSRVSPTMYRSDNGTYVNGNLCHVYVPVRAVAVIMEGGG